MLWPLLLASCSAPGQTVSSQSTPRHQQLQAVKTWGIQLTGYGNTRLEAVAASKFDLVVVDPTDDNAVLWTTAEVARAARGTSGQGKLLIAYLSMGAAESYRPYWKPGWRVGNPAWLLAEDPDWPGNYDVAYWNTDWQRIALAQLDRAIDAGFHGTYMDLIDAYQRNPERPSARADMVTWVCRIAAHARARDPEFLIIPQNAADLLTDPRYAACVDATGQEETFVYATDQPTEPERERTQLADYQLWKKAGKPVLTLDYANNPALVTQVYQKARQAGLVPYVTKVGLDTLPAPR
ncbi:MJ1477/TM1410 family putative glycoside hydrolase [Deinococcus oregonensis]|uniref:MJ1477/TM1410 family putative glycoside hydrolase n=1 Tax=Deinococcus oregonensis TaxID=1805970 RepID=A0ABV6B1R7_9DEIO